ncbi:MAG: M36 family metallopeptidase [Cryobacterium sp.]|nr:M36 family metallopeptidase [Oligoflexia bacterium]
MTKSTTGAEYCPESIPASPVAGTTGQGLAFELDPMIASGNATLSPASSLIGNYTSSVSLANLQGYGNLKGTYVDVISDKCNESYGSYSDSNDFRYPHSDERFAEVMSYYHGNRFRSELAASSSLLPASTFLMIANCNVKDNAYYSPPYGSQPPFLCMGYSSTYSATTSFSDDAEVIYHEMQHGVTGHAYSMSEDFNKLNFDEAGTMNEAISDFVALMQSDAALVSPFANTDFSRWSLGQFFSTNSERGASKCPLWAAGYSGGCTYFNKSASGFSSLNRYVSFSYPDGLGWPYAGPATGATLKSVYQDPYASFEEIHQAAPVFSGALFDIFLAIKASSGDGPATKRRLIRLVVETIKTLPKYSVSNPSPVTMPLFATSLLSVASGSTAGTFSGSEQTAMSSALSARGLTNLTSIADGWAAKGPGGIAVQAGTFYYETASTSGVRNYKMSPGDTGMLWFDVMNSQSTTAAAPLLKVTISDSTKATFVNNLAKNPGYINSTTAFVRYSKINGSAIVTAMNTGSAAQQTGITNSYFGPAVGAGVVPFGVNQDTALYVSIPSGAGTGSSVTFTVEVDTANKTSATSSVTFPVTIQ